MPKNLTHTNVAEPIAKTVQRLKDKAQKRGDLPHASVTRQCELIDQMASFELGRFLLQQQGGLNAYWTHYIVTHPEEKAKRKLTSLETMMLDNMPLAVATQERYQLFRKVLQKMLKKGDKMAGIPGGLMSEFLSLDYSEAKDISLTCIDIDPECFEMTKDLAKEKNQQVAFMQKDAWDLSLKEEFDVIASNGLNFYEPSIEKVIALYKQLYQALKKGGSLVTSFITYPPTFGSKSEWKIEAISLEAALIQRIIFADIIESKWQCYRSSREAEQELKAAGFAEVEILYDKARLFPTVIARKC